MRTLMIILSLTSLALLTACHHSCEDLQRQVNLLEQSNRTYAVKETPETNTQPSAYEFCGDEKVPCPTQTVTEKTTEEKQPNETTQLPTDKKLN